MWVLGIEPRSSGRAASALSHRAISLVLYYLYVLIYLFYVYGSFVCIYVRVPHMCLVPIEARG